MKRFHDKFFYSIIQSWSLNGHSDESQMEEDFSNTREDELGDSTVSKEKYCCQTRYYTKKRTCCCQKINHRWRIYVNFILKNQMKESFFHRFFIGHFDKWTLEK